MWGTSSWTGGRLGRRRYVLAGLSDKGLSEGRAGAGSQAIKEAIGDGGGIRGMFDLS
jgi:hypothetical protein